MTSERDMATWFLFSLSLTLPTPGESNGESMPFLAGESMGRVWFCRKLLLIFWWKEVESVSIHLLEHFSKYIFIPENTESAYMKRKKQKKDKETTSLANRFKRNKKTAERVRITWEESPAKASCYAIKTSREKYAARSMSRKEWAAFTRSREKWKARTRARAWESQSRKRNRKVRKNIKCEIW